MASVNDHERVKCIDASNMAALLAGLPDQLQEALYLYRRARCQYRGQTVKNVVLTGMGGSAIGGDLLRCMVEEDISVPMVVVRGYRLPAFVDEGTLMMGVSYSGNTEETLSAFQYGLDRGAMAYAITSGGRLGELAERLGIPCVRVPPGMPPRCTLGYLFIPSLLALADIGLIPQQGQDVEEAGQVLSALRDSYAPLSSRQSNPAKRLAMELQGMVPVVYGSARTNEAVAQRWKTQLNENSKAYAAYGTVPEMNHNEIVGWDAQPELSAKAVAIFLRDREDHPSVSRRMEINQSILRDKGLTVHECWSRGESRLARLFSLIYLGDYTSYYLALLYGIDPTPVEIIEELKRELAR